MTPMVRQFATALQSKAPCLGDVANCEWRVSKTPVPYEDALIEMEGRAEAVARGEEVELVWLLEHPSIYTAGTSAKPSDLLDAGRFPIHKTGRGGEYTYHGPGQLVAYAILDLNRRGRDIRHHVHRLEAWGIAALTMFGIEAARRKGRPGIWLNRHGADAKIGAVGVRVRRWVAYHGIAVNVCPDLDAFAGIVPCGITDAGVTSIAELEALGLARPSQAARSARA